MSAASTPARLTAALAAAVLTAALATGCGPDDDPSPAALPAATATVPSAPVTAKAAQTVQIGRTVYWGGLKYEVKGATYKPTDNGGYKLTLDTTVTNTFRTFAVRDWPQFTVDLAGTPVTGDQGSAVPPTPGASNQLPITFTAPADPDKPFAFDGASFVIGDPAQAQAVVPLGKGGREAVTLKPIDLALPADPAVRSGRLTLTLKTAQLRADFGDSNGRTSLTRGQRAVLVVFDMKGDVGPAGMAVAGEILRLKLPSGQEVGPTVAPIVAIYPDHPLYQNQAAWFVFDGATDGDYTLTVTDAPSAPPAATTFHAGALKDSGPLS